MPLSDFQCQIPTCAHLFEANVLYKAPAPSCPACTGESALVPSGFRMFTTIIPDYKGSRKFKAGYVHSHGDRPAEKQLFVVPGQST